MTNVKIFCPVCGTQTEIINANNSIAAANNSQVSSQGTACGCQNPKSAEHKIAALRNAGVDVSNLFSMKGADGGDALARLADGQLSIVPDDDPILQAIVGNGTIPDRRLFRRWIMAQVFHMMTQTDYLTKKPIGFTEALNRKGYKYSWEMVVEEFRVQAKLAKNDIENFRERNRWFNKDVAIAMATSYIELLKQHVNKLPRKKCKGAPYVRLRSNNIFVSDLQRKVYQPLEIALENIKKSRDPQTLYTCMHYFYYLVKKTYVAWDMPQNREFKDAYKGAGAYYTLKNLILFHGCVFPGMTKEGSMRHLEMLAGDVYMEGYKLLGVLKEFLANNNVDIKAKQRSWRNRR